MPHPLLTDSARYHQCALLECKGFYLELAYPSSQHQRWVLRAMAKVNPREDDLVEMQIVLFCPMCGHDCRQDARWRIPGKPGFNKLLDEATLL